MICSCSPAGIVRPVILLVLIVFMLGAAGCIEPFTGSDPSGKNADSAIPPGNETNISSRSEELTRGIQGFVARPVKLLDRSTSGSATIPVVRTTDTASWSGPALSAKGNEINMTEVQLQTETILPQ